MFLKGILIGAVVSLNTATFASTFDMQSFIQSNLKAPSMQVKGVTISPHIQRFDLLSKHLQAEHDKVKAGPMAQCLIAFGATSYNKSLPHPTNGEEKDVLTNALYSAVHYLHQQNFLAQEGIVAFIESKAKIFQEADHEYLAYLSSVLLASYNDGVSTTFVARKQTFIDCLAAGWLKEELAKDSYWQYMDTWNQHRLAPSAPASIPASAPSDAPKSAVDSLVELAKDLSETSDLGKAKTFAASLHDMLKTRSNFSLLVSGSPIQDQAAAVLIPALIFLEKFKMLDTTVNTDPSALDYYVSDAKNMVNQAVLLSLATAIQKSLLNPKATASKLLELVRYQKNSRSLSAARSAMDDLFTTGSIKSLITDDLIRQIQAASLAISATQGTTIDAEAQKQQLLTYDLPTYDLQAGTEVISRLPLSYFGSSGSGLQCGFFSLGFASRRQAIEQLVDNLGEHNIYVLADMVSGASGELKSIMSKYVSKKTAIPAKYLRLYAKNHALVLSDEKLLEHLTDAYAKLDGEISKAGAALDDEFEVLKKAKGLPARVPDGDDGTIANAFRALRQPFGYSRGVEQMKITQLFYPLADFQGLIEQSINEKFRSGMLEFDPNPDWQIGAPTYPHIMALLNHCDIYSWVSASTFAGMQASASATSPIYQTSDKAFVLTSVISGGEGANRVDILNKNGFHFEKWVGADRGALAKAIRHKAAYWLSNTK